MNFRNKSVSAHHFAMTPRPDIPRAAFNMDFTHKTTFDAGLLVPVLCEEVLPGDSFSVEMTAFARLATPIFPLMDNLHLDSFFFYVPNRLVWDNWVKFMGEQASPSDSISYVVPQIVTPSGGWPVGHLADYFGLPTVGQVAGGASVSHSALPLRAYNLIWNTWFRDQNLDIPLVVSTSDASDTTSWYNLARRRKRPDYFTTALPWPQKGGVAVSLPLGTTAPIVATGSFRLQAPGTGPFTPSTFRVAAPASSPYITGGAASGSAGTDMVYAGGLQADLSAATAATINQLRQAFQIQKLLERDARGGTRYAEIVRSHFGVVSPDARLQRPEYLGGGSQPMMVTPIAQNSATGVTGGSTPLGNLAGIGTVVARHGFRQSFTEHGYVIGMVSVRADLTYQQGLRRHWSRSTRYDFYFPAFANLGEQAILNKEIYVRGDANDPLVFGYQERWAEYRYSPGMITGLFRSTSAGTLDGWHLSQRFTSLPVLNSTFVADTPPLSRILAVGAGANGAQIIFDSVFKIRAVRPLPLFSVPGLIDHF
ncbi:MAG: major capsid protein [Microviridae sp.]|nr:MAG: major capsid protein [Microviridae sp.]